jgi:hypothetical protein
LKDIVVGGIAVALAFAGASVLVSSTLARTRADRAQSVPDVRQGIDRERATLSPAPADRTITPEMIHARGQYEHDRELLRTERPETLDDAIDLIGRRPDATLAPSPTSSSGIYRWYYDDAPAGRDVIQVVTQDGKVTLTDL